MPPVKRRVSHVLIVAASMLLIAAGVSALSDHMSESRDARGDSPQRLVYQTDHAAILRGCQQVLADPQAAGFSKPSSYGESFVDGSKPPAALPAALRALKFETMVVRSG